MLEAPSYSPRPDADGLRDEAWIAPLLVLHGHRVDHVVAGEAAAAAYGERPPAPGPLTVVPASYGRNRDRLEKALRDLEAEGLTIEVSHCPPGTEGFRDLLDDARPVRIAGDLEVLVASSEDLARMRDAESAAS
jgi:hypothetical protein